MEQKAGVQKRVLKGLRCLIDRDLEEAFLHLATAIDATSKKHYPRLGQKERYCQYLHKHQEDMFRIATLGSLVITGGFGHPVTKEIVRIADAIYKVRCASVHDPEELPAVVSFVHEGKFGFDEEQRFIINAGMLIAFALLLLTDPVNSANLNKQELARFGWIQHGPVSIDLTACIGGRTRLMRIYRDLPLNRQAQDTGPSKSEME